MLLSLLAISFLNPLLLWGSALAAIPLIIHILNRRRFKRVRWAAMEFLLRAFKKNRRRTRFEQILLLLLRMLLVALAAFLLSRPRASSDDVFGLTKRTAHHVLILDDSGSMGAITGVGTAMDTLKQRARTIVESLTQTRNGDLFTAIRTSHEEPGFLGRPITGQLRAEFSDFLSAVRPTPDRLRLGTTLERAHTATRPFEDQAERIQIYFVSDLRNIDLLGGEGELEEEIIKQWRKFPVDKLRVHVLPVGSDEPANLSVRSIERREARSIRGQSTTFLVTVENVGGSVSTDVDLGFEVDGGSRVLRKIASLGPGERKTEVFRASFKTAGSHYARAFLPKDRLPLDDQRTLAFSVAENASVLLVDGDPGERPEFAETFYLAAAFDPSDDSSSGFLVTRVDAQELEEVDFEKFDLVILANITSMQEEDVTLLEQYTRGGGGLIFFTGDQVETTLWNERFWKKGQGLLPAPLADVDGDIEQNKEVIHLAQTDHPIFFETAEAIEALIRIVGIGRYHRIAQVEGSESQLPDGCSAILRVDDDRGPPVLLERDFGEGKVLLFATTADAAWHSWQANPSYPIVMLRAAEHVMRREPLAPFNLGARDVLRHEISPVEYARDVRLLPATEGDDRIPERGFVAQAGDEQGQMLRIEAAPEPGRSWPADGGYRLLLRKIDGGEENLFFSVSAWEREGVPGTLSEQAFRAGLPQELSEKLVWLDAEALSGPSFLDEEGEVWRYLGFLLMGFLLLETLLAWRFGHH